MPLTIFSQANVRQIQAALDLPLDEVRDGSDLESRLLRVEDFDVRLGIPIAAELVTLLSELATLDTKIKDVQTDGTATAVSTAYRIDEYSETLSFGSGSGSSSSSNGGIVSSYKARRNDIIQRIKRDLGYLSSLPNLYLGKGNVPVM